MSSHYITFRGRPFRPGEIISEHPTRQFLVVKEYHTRWYHKLVKYIVWFIWSEGCLYNYRLDPEMGTTYKVRPVKAPAVQPPVVRLPRLNVGGMRKK